jgi:hypothetical protein
MGPGETHVDRLYGGGCILELCGPEVEGLLEHGGSGAGCIDQGADYWKGSEAVMKGEGDKQVARRAPPAGVHVAMVDNYQAAPSRAPKKCKFAELAGCTGSVAVQGLWRQDSEERDRIITNNKLCMFCLLHSSDEECFSKTNKIKPVCMEHECKGQHIKWLHKMLRELPCVSKEKECKINIV